MMVWEGGRNSFESITLKCCMCKFSTTTESLFDFSCTFPVPLSLRDYRDLGETTLILCLYFILFIIYCRMFWTDPFA